MNKTLKIFTTGDSPRSLKKISIFNWSGLAFLGTREHYRQVFDRQELSTPGIYFLVSQKDPGFFQIYIGETDNFARRIKDHADKKDWWDNFIVFVAKNTSLNKGHIKFLEREFFLMSQLSPQIQLMNEVEPGGAKLLEEDQCDLKTFMDHIHFILETLGLSYFSRGTAANQQGLEYMLKLSSKKDYVARLSVRGDSFIVLKGSHINLRSSESFYATNSAIFKRWKEIVHDKQKVQTLAEEVGQLVQDLEFSSASAAAAFVRARSQNGLTEWKNVQTSKSMNEESEELEDLKAS